MASLTQRFEQATIQRDIPALQEIFQGAPDIHNLSKETGWTLTQLFPWATLAGHVPSMKACIANGASITSEVEENAHLTCGLDAYRILVPAGLDVNKHFGYGGTALTEAIMSNDEDFVQFLLESGADPNIGTLNGSTALEVAVKESLPVKSIGSIIDHGAEFPTKGIVSLAVLAGDADIVDFLIKKGANVNETTDDSFETTYRGKKMSMLHLAVTVDGIDVIKVLIQNGIDQMARDVDGKTALDFALQSGRTDIVKALESN